MGNKSRAYESTAFLFVLTDKHYSLGIMIHSSK